MMEEPISCSYCKLKIDLAQDPLECYVCSLGHALCEYCNNIARGFCFHCGGPTARRLPEKHVRELYRASPKYFMQKILESRTLVLPQSEAKQVSTTDPKARATTVIGSHKWPPSFFNKVPTTLDKITSNEQHFLKELPNIIKDDDASNKDEELKTGWDCLPKHFTSFKLAAEVLQCPITSCKFPICNSDAMRHLLQNHDDIAILSLPRNVIGEFSLDAKSVRKNEIKCAMRLLVPGVIKDLGITKHKDCLPLYLLYTRVNSFEVEEELSKPNRVPTAIYSDEPEERQVVNSAEQLDDDAAYTAKHPWQKHDFLVIWCAGVVPLDHAITIAITVLPRGDKTMSLGGIMRVFSLHVPQSSQGIYSNTERLIISRHDLKRLTKLDFVIDGQICVL